MNFDRTNTYKGTCFLCGAGVAAGHGRLLIADEVEGVPKPEGRKWLTLCNSRRCVDRVLGTEVAASSDRCEIEADGTIHVPNPAMVKPFLCAIGARVEDRWVASPHRRDRDHVLRVTEKMGLKVAPEFAQYEDPKPVRDAVARARAAGLREYQIEGVRRGAYTGIDDSLGYADAPRFDTKGRLRGFTNCDDPGLGKSVQTLYSMHDDEALVIGCNASAKSVWVHEAKKWRSDRFDTYTVIEGELGFRWPKNTRELVVCNYDILPRSPAQIKDKREQENAKLNGHRAQPNSKAKWRRKTVPSLLRERTRCTRKLRKLIARWDKSITTADRHRLFVAMGPLAELVDKIKRVRQAIVRNDKRKPLVQPPCPVLLVGDELHYVESSQAIRTKAWRYVTRFARRVMGLTGTPVESNPSKLYGLLTSACANPFTWELFKQQFNAFENKWSALEFGRHAPRPGSTALGSVKVEPGTTELIQRVLLRRTKEQVLPELPPKVYSEIPVAIPPKLRKQLDALAAEHMDELTLDADGEKLTPFPALSKTLKLLSVACIPTMIDLVESYELQGVPLVVFSPNRPPIEKLAARTGWLTSLNDLDTLQERFQSGEGHGVAGTSSIAVSLTLTRASTVVQVMPFLSRKQNEQCVDRCHRIGQDDCVNVIQLVPDHVLVRHIYALLAAKDEFVDDVLEGESTPDVSATKLVDEDESVWLARVAATQARQSKTPARARVPESPPEQVPVVRAEVTAEASEARAKARARALGIKSVTGVDATPLAVQLQDALDQGKLSPPAATVAAWLMPGVCAELPFAVASAVALLSDRR